MSFVGSLNAIKKLVGAPILVFSNLNVEFYMHVDASSIALGGVLVQLGERDLNDLVYFASRILSQVAHNYTTMEREGLTVVYAL